MLGIQLVRLGILVMLLLLEMTVSNGFGIKSHFILFEGKKEK